MFAVINEENNDLEREGYQPRAPDGERLEGGKRCARDSKQIKNRKGVKARLLPPLSPFLLKGGSAGMENKLQELKKLSLFCGLMNPVDTA